MIDITKPVTLRCKRPARVYTDKGMDSTYPLIGEYREKETGAWQITCWTRSGEYSIFGDESDLNLIQDTAIEFTIWANVYPSKSLLDHINKESADGAAMRDRIGPAIPLRIRIDGDNVTIMQIKDES